MAPSYHDVSTPHSPAASRGRKSSLCSEDFKEQSGKLNIGHNAQHKKRLKFEKFSPEFRFNAEMSLRVAVGVIVASAIQTRDSDYDPSADHAKKWALFPSWYYLGGLSYCAVAVIFSAGKNIGETVKKVCQAFYGVGMALVYNIILFSVVDVRLYDSTAADPYDGFVQIEKTFSSSPYWVNPHNFYIVLPWMILFTVAILLLPFENNTKKFALANNLYFALTLINPADPLDSSELKAVGDNYFNTSSILHNLEMYFLVGFIGTLISLVIMFVPYPIFAIKRLRAETLKASGDVLDLLNIIVDSYCFKNKNVEDMKFLKLKLHRHFDAAEAHHQKMTALLDDVWWEQMLGFHFLLKFNRSVIKHYVTLIGSLIADLKALSHAMQLEQYDKLHITFMKVLQREIYMTQMQSGKLLNEISKEVHASTERLDLQSMKRLEVQMERTLHRYRSVLVRTLSTENVSHKEIEGNIPLNLFLFSLNSLCRTLLDFQDTHNHKEFGTGQRARQFLIYSITSFFACHRYSRQNVLTAFKVAMAIIMGIFLAVYVYAFSSTTPAAVAYVMGNHIGGSFSVTVNRVGGVVAGSVVPSVFQFFILQICDPRFLNIALSSIVLFIWVTMSMYVSFSGGYSAYAGLVSAFISAGILLRQSDVCYANGSDSSSSIAISSYSSLAQTSVGIVLFILVELAMCPESATSLLRKNIQNTLKEQQRAFEILFGFHSSRSNSMDKKTMEDLRNILESKVPALLVEQKALLKEANAEPLLWKPAFSLQKYESVLESSADLLNSNNLLLKLVRWFQHRVESNNLQLKSIEIHGDNSGDDHGPLTPAEDSGDKLSIDAKWEAANKRFLLVVVDTFDALQSTFGEKFLYSDQEQTALFMHMKEAFRKADEDCSGSIDAHEVAVMLETIFAESHAVRDEDIHKYVSDFMKIVDTDASGKVSFEEFMAALENGLKLEVEVYHRRQPKAMTAAHRHLSERLGQDNAGGAHLDRIVEETGTTQNSLNSSLEDIKEEDAARADDDIEAAAKPSNTAGTPRAQPVPTRSRSTVSNGKEPSLLSPMRRKHDILNVENFTITEMADQMQEAYVDWLMENRRFATVSMEELLLLNCLVSGAEGVALNLTALQKIVLS